MPLLGNVIRRSVPGFPTSPLSPATTHVVLRKENHTQLTEAATLDRKSGEAEGPAVQRTLRGNVFQESATDTNIIHLPSCFVVSRVADQATWATTLPNETRPCEPDPQPAPCAEP